MWHRLTHRCDGIASATEVSAAACLVEMCRNIPM